ncbi:MAG: GAF domain-containing protein [Anaerolineae bacterium]|nr:GAF domain-containing protein [Anaerolineae bacterium]
MNADTQFPEVGGPPQPFPSGPPLQAGLERRLQQLQSLQHLSVLLGSSLDLKAILQALVHELRETFGYARVHVALHREGYLVPMATAGYGKAPHPIAVTEGIAGLVFRTKRPAFVPDVREDPHYLVCDPTTVQEICVPLTAGEKVLGVLNVEVGPDDTPLTEDDAAFLQEVAQQAALAVENALLFQQQARMAQRLKAIAETARELIALDETQPFPMRAARRIQEALDCYSVSLFLQREGRLEWVAGAVGFVGGELPYGARVPLGKGIVTHVFETGRPWLARDVRQDPYYLPFDLLPHTQAEVAVPLRSGEQVIGVLDVQDDEVGALDEGDVEVLEILAGLLAVALENDQLFAQVARAKQEWEQTFDAMADAVLLVSPAHRVLRCNRAAARLVGLEPCNLVGQHYYQALWGREEPLPQCPLEEALRTGEPVAREMEFSRLPGRVFHVSAVPRWDPEGAGTLLHVILVLREVTREHHLRRQLAQAEKLSAVGQLVSGVAHELNNPLTSVLGYAQLLQMRDDLPSDVQEDLGRIAAEARRASHIVRSLLTFAQEQKTTRQRVQVNDLVQQVLELQASNLRADGIAVVTDLAPDLPEISADPYRLQQVLLNLVSNAQQAMAEAHGRGTLTVQTSLREGWLRIAVADDGPGIPPEHLGRVFDPFFTTKEVGQGTGLGLSICYGIVTEHGGHIWAESQPGQGATFYVELPLAAEAPDRQAEGARKITLPVQRGHILVVDDEPLIRTMLDRYLSPLGHEVDLADSAEAAQERVRQDRYDAIFCDLKMPGPGGQGFYRWLEKQNPDAARRVIFVTGDALSPEVARFLEEAGAPCLEKPFRLEDVVRVLHRVLRPGSGPPPPGAK